MTREKRKSCEPAKLLRSIDLPAFAPVARNIAALGQQHRRRSVPQSDRRFFLFCYLTSALCIELALPRTGFIATSMHPDYGAFGRGAVVYGP